MKKTTFIIYFAYKNVDRIIDDYEKNIFSIYQPWPLHEELILDKDYKKILKNNIFINLRLPTNKLLMGNLENKNNYILHCGNINMLCTPEEKFRCIREIRNIFSYLFISNDTKNCLSLYKINVLY